MKSTKKLFIATLMLVFAFVAVVSSTFAWFTVQQEAEVNKMNLQASSAGTDLQISTNGTEYGYSINLGETSAKLVPVTFDASDNGFKQLAIDTADGENKNKFKYEAATPLTAGATEGEGYLTFDLYFKTSSVEDVNLNLDVSNIFAAVDPGDEEILGTLRIMFVPFIAEAESFDSKKIYEHLYNEGSTFGTGAYYSAANNYIAYNAFTHSEFPFLNAQSDGKFTLNSAYFTGKEYTKTEVVDDKVSLGTINAAAAQHFKVYIWLEGWDGDTNNSAALQKFSTYLKFTN